MSIFQQRSLDATGNPGGPAHRFVMSATAQFDRWFVNAWFGWPSERMGVLLFIRKKEFITVRVMPKLGTVVRKLAAASLTRFVWLRDVRPEESRTNQLLGLGGWSPIFLSVSPCVRLRIFYRSMATFSTRHTCR